LRGHIEQAVLKYLLLKLCSLGESLKNYYIVGSVENHNHNGRAQITIITVESSCTTVVGYTMSCVDNTSQL